VLHAVVQLEAQTDIFEKAFFSISRAVRTDKEPFHIARIFISGSDDVIKDLDRPEGLAGIVIIMGLEVDTDCLKKKTLHY
jgi:hypothetical protein